MRNQANMQNLKANARLDALLKNQENEHKHLISSHHKEMQELRDTLNLSMEKFQSLFDLSQKELKDFKTYAVCIMGILKEKIIANELIISNQKKTIEDLNKQFMVFQDTCYNKEYIEKFKKQLIDQTTNSTANHIVSFQQFQSLINNSLLCVKDEFNRLKNNLEEKLYKAQEKSDTNYSIEDSQIKGILKDIVKCKKDSFILEKKIENIYTLIERINKKGETCPKPE